MPKRQFKWMAWLFLVLQWTACSGGAPSPQAVSGSGSAPAPDACAIVTAADVEQVLGIAVKVRPGDALKTIGTTSLCNYDGAHDSRGTISVLIRLGTPDLDAAANLKQYVSGLKMNMGDAYQIDPVEGLSGPAVWNPGMKQLTVFKGSALTILTMSETGANDPLQAAKTLGEKALARM
jgi:hypothetical protein